MTQIQEPKKDVENYSRNDQHLPDCISELPWTSTSSVSSVAQSHPTLCGPMNRNTPGLPVHHQLPEYIQTHVH